MKLGIAKTLAHVSPEEWAQKHRALGLSAVCFPCSHTDDQQTIDRYVQACRVFDLQIAEVGAWKNLLVSDLAERETNFAYCKGRLELAEYIGADCCVNISGAKGEIWDGPYRENYSEKTYEEIILTVQRLIDAVKPRKTFYTLEPMPWMHPFSPEDYLQMIRDIDRDGFAVHMDIVNMINTPEKYLFCREFTDCAFAILGKYIKSCHIKDVVLQPQLTTIIRETALGTGGFDLKHYIDCIDTVSPEMSVVIEHLDGEDDYIRAVEYVKSITGGTEKHE